jgi:hypothetical protein
MSIIEQAASELDRANFDSDEKQAILEIMKRFFETFDSGGAVHYMLPVLVRLMSGQPLSPLTGDDNEWYQPIQSEPMLQNVRQSSVFKILNPGAMPRLIYDIDNPAWDGTFPYSPPSQMPELPVMEFDVPEKGTEAC